jgi:two-component system capsular synthesis sensor histidine kinase RcsC
MPARHILIADDDDTVRAFLARVVVRTYPSLTLTTVKDGAEALATFGQRPVDLLITNAHMPNLNGLDLIRALRAQQITVPILMVSASPEVEASARAAGVTRFLLKPVPLRILQQALRELLPP